MRIWINRRLVNSEAARISVFDRGFLYGDGAFETMRSYAGVAFKLNEHLSRLFASLGTIKIRLPYGKGFLEDAIYMTLKTNGLRDAYIRLTVTRGEGRFGLDSSDIFRPNIVIVTKAFAEYPDWMYAKGISAKVAGVRQNEYSPVSGIKSLNFLNYILARLEAKEDAFDEAILMNTKGHIAEGASSNIFLVKRNTLFTPSLGDGVIPGVTRAAVIRIAKAMRLGVRERHISYRELVNSDEVFLTNSLVEVLPVTRIDSKRISRGAPGDITKLIRISYQKHVIKSILSR